MVPINENPIEVPVDLFVFGTITKSGDLLEKQIVSESSDTFGVVLSNHAIN